MNNNVHLFSDDDDDVSNDSVMNEIYGCNELPSFSSRNNTVNPANPNQSDDVTDTEQNIELDAETEIVNDNWIAQVTQRDVSINDEVKEEYEAQYLVDTGSSVYVKFEAAFDNSKRGEQENMVQRTVLFDPEAIDWLTPIEDIQGVTCSNIERIKNGKNPVDHDGNYFNYHHIDQNVEKVVLLSHATHKSQYTALHGLEKLSEDDRKTYERIERKTYNKIVYDLIKKSSEIKEILEQYTGAEYKDAQDFAKLPIPEIEVEEPVNQPSLWENFKQRVVEEEKRQKAEMVDDIVEGMGCAPVIIFMIGVASSLPLTGVALVFFLIH